MPTVAVDKEELWERLGHRYCAWLADFLFFLAVDDNFSAASEDFDNLLFEFGLELDDDVRGSFGQRLTS